MAQQWAELLMRDHEKTEQVLEAGGRLIESGGVPDKSLLRKLLDYLTSYTDGCHNKKEEDHLFPLIERLGVPREGGPLAVMLSEHEQSRGLLAELQASAEAYLSGESSDTSELQRVYRKYADLLKNHYWKENDILYPMAQRLMSEQDQTTVMRGIATAEDALGPGTRDKYYALAEEIITGGEVKDLVYGLDHGTLGAMLNTLPVELSFVDAQDTVRYFSHENQKKIFPRTRGAIGMKVQNCHPAKSVHLVNRILEDFKAGKRDVAEFWIDFQGMKVHIRYWPVRSPEGHYLGCLETVQDVTPIQKLEGQHRLLDDA